MTSNDILTGYDEAWIKHKEATLPIFIAGQFTAARQIQDSFYWICEAHNEWVAENPDKGKVIDLETIDTREGAIEALSRLRLE